jgi:hypothetical protein
VTFGAGGSTQHGTRDTVLEIIGEGHRRAAPVLRRRSRASLRAILEDIAQGIKRLVALRGDLPSGYGAWPASSEFRHANELVEFIRAETGDWFHIEVAAYPEMHPQALAAGRPAELRAQGEGRRQFGHHPVLLQRRRLLPLRRRRRQAGRTCRCRRHHAHHQLHAADALLGHVRRRDPALDPPEAGQLRRRHGSIRPSAWTW